MVKPGELLTFIFDDYEVNCRVARVAKDCTAISVVEQPNTFRMGKPCSITITRPDGVINAGGVVVKTKKADEAVNGPGMLEYIVKITKPFKKVQKRNAFRFECYLPATVNEEESNQSHGCHILDISSGGAKILTRYRFAINSVVNIVTMLEGRNMHLQALVLALDAAPDTVKGYKYAMRTKFTEVTQKDEETIVRYIFTEYRKTAKKRTGKKE